MKLSKTQQELVDYIKGGGVVSYMEYMGSFNPSEYWFRHDNGDRVTAAAKALIKKGVAYAAKEKDRRGLVLKLK